jgi:uncharacterized glyoxalase superfamily protein PhnB
MSETTQSNQRVIPMLAYADAPAAIDFLCNAFGFQERFRMEMPNGKIGHAEVALGGHIVMLATEWTAAGLASPSKLPGLHSQLYCEVDDVDAHYEKARQAGAVVIAEPQDQPHGSRTYRAVDLEGHRWIFGSPLAKTEGQGADQSQ